MGVDGKWKLIMKSPMGAMPAELQITSSGGEVSGTMSGQGRSNPIEGTLEGDMLVWTSRITSPMPMTMEFSGTVDGEEIAGSVKAGAFGSFKFTGRRE